jgi:hypothetical protein
MRFLALLSLLAIGSHGIAAEPVAFNKTCPVSGKPVDTSVKMRTYNPKTDQAAKATSGATVDPDGSEKIGFCCPKCEPEYEKDPAKYNEKLEKQRTTAK